MMIGKTLVRAALAVALAAGLSQAALARSHGIDAVQGAGQTLEYKDGLGVLTSTRKDSIVQVSSKSRRFDKQLGFVVAIASQRIEPLNVDPADITVTTESGLQLAAFSVDQLEAKARNRAKWARIATAVSTMGDSDDAAAEIGRMRAHHEMREINADLSDRVDYLERNMLKRHTLHVNEAHAGLVMFETPPRQATSMIVHVKVADEVHDFTFAIQP